MQSGSLAHYHSVLDGERNARYLDLKNDTPPVALGADASLLWEEHDRLIREGPGRGSRSILALKSELARRMLKDCHLCERKCGVDRTAGMKGHCRVLEARISSEFVHMGEEPDLVPSYTIFFSGCTFNCVFCQNWDISTRPESGTIVDPSDLALRIERISGYGKRPVRRESIKNVNWVGGDPTSNIPFILDVLQRCRANVPQVWNSNMYLSIDAMRLIRGIVDVYLTDFKYGNDRCAERLSGARGYMRIMRRNHLLARADSEMIIRHLVLPGHISCCTEPALTWIAENLPDVKVNVMSQYRPEHKARQYPEISHPISMSEFERAIEIAEGLGLELCE